MGTHGQIQRHRPALVRVTVVVPTKGADVATTRVTTGRAATGPTAGTYVRRAESPSASGKLARLIRTLVDANIDLGRAQLEAVSEIADNLLSSAGSSVLSMGERAGMVDPKDLTMSAEVRRVEVTRTETTDTVEHPTVRVTDVTARPKFLVDLPGVAAENIIAEATSTAIEILAYRTLDETGARIRYDASIALDRPIEHEDVVATYSDGVLTVEIGGLAAASRRRVEVSTGDNPRGNERDRNSPAISNAPGHGLEDQSGHGSTSDS